tara:strand:- start:13 stop:654 length:642 start_codon:yes stop_codon:yes gene_type:complete
MPPTTKKHNKKPKTSKVKKVVETPAPVVEAPAPVVEAPAPVVETPAPVVETPEPVVETTEVLETPVSEEFDTLLNDLKTLKQTVIDMVGRVSKLQKRVARDSRKGKKKGTRSTSGNKNNGFSKPVEITPELCKFLSLDPGTLIARTSVTKGITKYIKEHNLQGKEDKRVINVDNALKKLLSGGAKPLTNDVPLTYFNLQTYLKRHYPKTVVVS